MKCLNPFEVREVLQERTLGHHWPLLVSIPLKSGRCCKLQYATALQYIGRLNPFEVREVLQENDNGYVKDVYVSQSLWSQGGAASKRSG